MLCITCQPHKGLRKALRKRALLGVLRMSGARDGHPMEAVRDLGRSNSITKRRNAVVSEPPPGTDLDGGGWG